MDKMSLRDAYMSATAPAPKPTKAKPVDDESIKDKLAEVISRMADVQVDAVRKVLGDELTGRLSKKENAKEVAELMIAPVPKIIMEIKEGNTFPVTRKLAENVFKLLLLPPGLGFIPEDYINKLPIPRNRPPIIPT